MVSLDRAINNDFLTISKSLIPYLPLENQKSLAIFVKTFELMQTINLFSKDAAVHSMSRSHEAGWEKEFLKDVRQNLSGDRGYFIDALLKLTEVRDLIDNHAENNYTEPTPSVVEPYPNDPTQSTPTNNGPTITPNDVIDKLSSMLEPNQVQLLKVLSSFIK
ncbi:hypothetical protein [Cellulosilyticum ruminicola]|uniref:hypothetical protein n=1 Tax=Cellulosilyticum ruminicola TaxID=425254 RepID=UPI0006CFF823|nr:hypothetical protein [Cellulosilyticum ruminicola]